MKGTHPAPTRTSSAPPLALLLLALLLTSHGFLAAADLNADAQALLGFLHGLAGAARVNWRNDTSPCSAWVGVGCNAAGDRVQSLKLPGSGLYGQILPGTLGLLSDLRILSLRVNKLSGPLPADLANCTQLRSLFLQDNTLSGSLPSFNTTPGLNVINLSFNKFTGSIPPSLNGLTRLKVLLLQNNSLTGSIPALNTPGSLAQLNLSNNDLNGSIPSTLRNFSSSSFSGNNLCGPPLLTACARSPPPPSSAPGSPMEIVPSAHKKSRKLTTPSIILIVVLGGAALLVLLSACFLVWFLRRQSSRPAEKPTSKGDRAFVKRDDSKDEYSSAQEPEHNKLVFFQGGQNSFDLEDLLRASAEVLGKGSFGTAYKAVLEDGCTVVVKRLKEVSVGRKEFEQQMDVVGKLRHRNLVPLRAYYYSKEEKLLVHDYLPMGSLSTVLHGNKGSGESALDWDARLKIAIAAARGLAHLHQQGGNNKFTHGDIKSSNVLLHREYDACVSDFGLSSLFNPNTSASRLVGYRAPEVAETRKVTQKSDVYSFGVMLLELLTGKTPSQTTAEEGMDLPRWVQSVVREEWTSEVFDVDLMRYENIEEEMVQTLQIALTCVSTAPDQRPKISEVLRMIEDVKQFETDDGNTQSSSAEVLPSSSAEQKSNESAGQAAPETSSPVEHMESSTVSSDQST